MERKLCDIYVMCWVVQTNAIFFWKADGSCILQVIYRGCPPTSLSTVGQHIGHYISCWCWSRFGWYISQVAFYRYSSIGRVSVDDTQYTYLLWLITDEIYQLLNHRVFSRISQHLGCLSLTVSVTILVSLKPVESQSRVSRYFDDQHVEWQSNEVFLFCVVQ